MDNQKPIQAPLGSDHDAISSHKECTTPVTPKMTAELRQRYLNAFGTTFEMPSTKTTGKKSGIPNQRVPLLSLLPPSPPGQLNIQSTRVESLPFTSPSCVDDSKLCPPTSGEDSIGQQYSPIPRTSPLLPRLSPLPLTPPGQQNFQSTSAECFSSTSASSVDYFKLCPPPPGRVGKDNVGRPGSPLPRLSPLLPRLSPLPPTPPKQQNLQSTKINSLSSSSAFYIDFPEVCPSPPSIPEKEMITNPGSLLQPTKQPSQQHLQFPATKSTPCKAMPKLKPHSTSSVKNIPIPKTKRKRNKKSCFRMTLPNGQKLRVRDPEKVELLRHMTRFKKYSSDSDSTGLQNIGGGSLNNTS